MIESERRALITLDLTFIALAGLAASLGKLPQISPGWLPVLFGLATFRAARALSFNLIFKPLREALGIIEQPDGSGAGNNNEPTGSGPTRIMAELMACPICSGTWAALVLVGLYAIVPAFGQVLVYALAAAGLSEIVHWQSERAQWAGRASREQCGAAEKARAGLITITKTQDQAEIEGSNGRG